MQAPRSPPTRLVTADATVAAAQRGPTKDPERTRQRLVPTHDKERTARRDTYTLRLRSGQAIDIAPAARYDVLYR